MLPKNRAYGCSPCASVQLQFQPAPVFRDRGFGIWVVLHAPRIRMMRGPAVAMPDLVLTDVGDQAGILLALRQGDAANPLADPRRAFWGGAMSGSLANRGATTSPGYGWSYCTGGSRNTIIGKCCYAAAVGIWGAYGMRLFAALFFVVLAWGLAWGSEAAM